MDARGAGIDDMRGGMDARRAGVDDLVWGNGHLPAADVTNLARCVSALKGRQNTARGERSATPG